MIVGLIIALVGALGGLVGSLVAPWIDTDVVKFADPSAYAGYAWWPGLVATILLAAGLALVIAGLVLARKRKLLAIINLFVALGVFVFAFLTPFAVRSSVNEMIAAGTIPESTRLAMFYGYHFIFFGNAVMAFGLAFLLGQAGTYRADDKLLRVAHLWHGRIIRETTITEHHDITVGGQAGADFLVPLTSDPESDESVQLFKHLKGDEFALKLNADMHGRVNIDHKLMSIQDAVALAGPDGLIKLGLGDWGTIDFGFNQIFFNMVHPDVVIGRGGASKTGEGTFIAAMTACAFIAVFVWILAQFAWDPAGSIERHASQRKVMKVEAAVSMEKDEILLDLGEEEEDDVGKRAEGEEGKFGDPDNNPDLENKVPKRDGQMAAKIDVKNVGLADLLSNKMGKGGAISSILSDNTDAFENRMAVAMAGTGSELVVGYGAGGMGFKGTGSGGGGTGGYGRIHGLGRVDTGGGMGMRAGLGKKGARKVGKMKIGGMGSSGFCQKSNIEAVVKQRAGAIRACYEAQLQLHDGLAGKVAVRWTINLEGRVDAASVTNSTLGNAKVESCVLRVIRRMRFAKPEGGICVVQWPFVFSPG